MTLELDAANQAQEILGTARAQLLGLKHPDSELAATILEAVQRAIPIDDEEVSDGFFDGE